MVRSRVPSVQAVRCTTGTTFTPAACSFFFRAANFSLPSAAQPPGTSPLGFLATSRPSCEASTLWTAAIVSSDGSMLAAASSSSQ